MIYGRNRQKFNLESRVKVKQKQGPRCNITHIQVLRENRQWAEVNKTIFGLGWSDELNISGLFVSEFSKRNRIEFLVERNE